MFACACYVPANAFTIDSSTQAGDTFDVSWELLSGATDLSGNLNDTGSSITGSATFEILGITGSTIGFELTLRNTTDPSNIGLDSFGFGTDADFSVVSWNGNPAANVSAVDSSGNPIPGVSDQFVATTEGGAPGGLPPGGTEPFVFGLELPDVIDRDTNPVTVSPLEAIHNEADPGPSARSLPDNNDGTQSFRVAVPVPGTLLLMGAGLLLIRRHIIKLA